MIVLISVAMFITIVKALMWSVFIKKSPTGSIMFIVLNLFLLVTLALCLVIILKT